MAAPVLKAQSFIKNGFIYPKRDEIANFVRDLLDLTLWKLRCGFSCGEPASLLPGPGLPARPLRALLIQDSRQPGQECPQERYTQGYED